MFPAAAAGHGREYELYACYSGRSFWGDLGVLVHHGEAVYGAEDRLGGVGGGGWVMGWDGGGGAVGMGMGWGYGVAWGKGGKA